MGKSFIKPVCIKKVCLVWTPNMKCYFHTWAGFVRNLSTREKYERTCCLNFYLTLFCCLYIHHEYFETKTRQQVWKRRAIPAEIQSSP